MSGRRTTPPAAWMTERNLALARDLWDAGVATTEIGRRCGTTKDAIVGYAHRNAWPPRPSPIGRHKGEARQAAPRTPPKLHHKPVQSAKRRKPPAAAPGRREACNPLPLAVPTVAFRHCQWTESPGRPWQFCAEPATRGAWCETHWHRVYVRPPRWDRLGLAA